MNEDRVYVIYYKGKRYDGLGRKIAYLTEGRAKSVVTADSKKVARREYDYVTGKDWYDLPSSQRKELVKKAKSDFKIVEYGPVKEE